MHTRSYGWPNFPFGTAFLKCQSTELSDAVCQFVWYKRTILYFLFADSSFVKRLFYSGHKNPTIKKQQENGLFSHLCVDRIDGLKDKTPLKL